MTHCHCTTSKKMKDLRHYVGLVIQASKNIFITFLLYMPKNTAAPIMRENIRNVHTFCGIQITCYSFINNDKRA